MSELAFADPAAAFAGVRAQLLAAAARVLDGGSYILGPEVAAFEAAWAAACETEHAVGVSSGTDALALALRAVGVGPGDEVLVPAMTAPATWMAVAQIGAVPVGVDIETATGGMDPAAASAALGPRTRALVAVHLYGQPVDVAGLAAPAERAGVPLVEDAAHAHLARSGGRRVGSLGAAAAFSFYPTKNLGAPGDAGAVTTRDAEVAERVRRLRQYGWRGREETELRGVNARLDELQAALLGVLLDGLEAATARRRAIAARYRDGLAGLAGLTLPPHVDGDEPAWHLFVVGHADRDGLRQRLAAAGVGTGVHYDPPPSSGPAFGAPPGSFPVAERHAATALSLPMHPALRDEDVDRVVAALHAAIKG